jgi:hypothetical protein
MSGLMNLTTLLRENTGLLVMLILLAIGTIVIGTFAIAMTRAGVSLRPIVFVGGLFALVLLPQLAFHLGVATKAIPRRNLTWMPAADRAAVHGWVEQEPALAARDGKFVDLSAVFGSGVDVTLGSDPRVAGATSPFAKAEVAHMMVLPPEGSAIVARFADAAAADAAARDYARQALGLWPNVGRDGLRTATRPAGDVVKIAQAGRTLVIVSGANEGAIRKQLLTLGAIAPGRATSDPGSEKFWLYQPGVLPALAVLLVLSYVFLFFKGAVWAGSVPAVPGVQALSEYELRNRLLTITSADVPITLTEEGGRLVATWRFADARWLDLARARQMKYEQRVLMELDPESRVVRVTEQMTRFDASAGRGGATIEWRTQRGVTFFHVERGREFGLQFDDRGRPMPKLDYAWRFDAQEMKAPLIEAVTRAGWQWRPTPWSGPESLRWLTD